jgi:hypothetical protein
LPLDLDKQEAAVCGIFKVDLDGIGMRPEWVREAVVDTATPPISREA